MPKRAWLNLRLHKARNEMFAKGLKRHGFEVSQGWAEAPGDDDVFVTWNRIGAANLAAKKYRRVLVVENASWGNEFAGDLWYHIAKGHHNTGGRLYVGDTDRWDGLGVELPDWRTDGETVILPQRGIGSDPVRMPAWFPRKAQKEHGGRIRKHPGKLKGIPLEADLGSCGKAVTWGSGAAVKALLIGIPVVSYMPNWIAEQNNTDDGRLEMFRRLAWAQWRHSEIESGIAFEYLLN